MPRLAVSPRGDLALALAVTAVGAVDVISPELFSTHLTGPRWSSAVLVCVAGLSLAWRRSEPLAVLVVVGGALTLQALVYGASEGNAAFLRHSWPHIRSPLTDHAAARSWGWP